VEALVGAQSIAEGSGDDAPAAAAAPAVYEGGWASRRPAVRLPWGVGPLAEPIFLRVDSPTLSCRVEGWRTGGGYTYLARPAEASVELTPPLARRAA
jgi:hypothetical protein